MLGRRFLGGEPCESGRNKGENFIGEMQGPHGFTEGWFEQIARVAEFRGQGREFFCVWSVSFKFRARGHAVVEQNIERVSLFEGNATAGQPCFESLLC